jgi:MYXO-CTERM domain-containing protein
VADGQRDQPIIRSDTGGPANSFDYRGGGCNCEAGGESRNGAAFVWLGLALVFGRRRRSR